MAEKKVTLEIKNVSKSFAKVENDEVTHALNEIDLTLESGEFVSLVGPSGCGKSTILRLVAGLITPTTGKLTVDGKEITEPSPERGMMFQKSTLFPWLTVEKNIAFSLKMQGKLKGNEDKVERLLKVIGLEAFRNDYPGQLSGGMAQRVALMRSLINEPDILLLDEPTNHLDRAARERGRQYNILYSRPAFLPRKNHSPHRKALPQRGGDELGLDSAVEQQGIL